MADKLRDDVNHQPQPTASNEENQPEEVSGRLVGIGSDISLTTAARRPARSLGRRHERYIRSTPPIYRWVCPCQTPPILLATYGPNGRINIKVRDRYWHLQGFGMVEAICPRCAAEHMLDMRLLRNALDNVPPPEDDDIVANTAD
ncbi:MAG TPA: hypothetical protein VFQ54_05635 [Thermomicrobiales bacterium]|nr:hypothetical protein [Thermomicrobiales bacterium]